jgi:tRNA nucleotidyltransferase/poly(A) polymerase
LTVFLVGGAVRDLTSGSRVRDLDVAVQGNALKLKKDLEKAGAVVTGEWDTMQALYVCFPGRVRMEIASTLSVQYPKPGKPVVKPATILDDLRRRDFTANAMALSLNAGSYGLLMDPLNGVADIENRELRLVSNYGFIEDPVRMVRAARYSARLGWLMEEKTKARYDTGKSEGYIDAMSAFQRGYETEEIAHEEDPVRVLRRLEQEGWMKHLAPAWTSAKANLAELDKLRDALMHLQERGIYADTSAAQFPLLTAKLPPKDVAALKKSFARPGFVEEIAALDGEGKKFAAELGSKQAASPSAAWKMLMAAKPEAVLWAAYSSKNAGLQAKFKSFYTEWPLARQKTPYAMMAEMRIVPDVPRYEELLEKVFFELMDGKLTTDEDMKAFLEPYSPPAPPPTVHLRRPRAAKKEPKSRKKAEGSAAPEAGEGLTEAAVAADQAPIDSSVKEAAAPKASAVTGKTKAAVAAKVYAPAKPVTPVKAAAAAKGVAGKAAPAKAMVKKAAPVKVAKKTAAPAKAVKKAAPRTVVVKSAKKPVAAKAKPKAKAPAKSKPVKKVAAKKPVVKTAAKKKR